MLDLQGFGDHSKTPIIIFAFEIYLYLFKDLWF